MKTDQIPMQPHRPTIAILNDEPIFQHLLGELLVDEGYQTIQSRMGAEGFAIVRAAQPDLVLLDVQLGAYHHWTTVELLQLDPVTVQIPLVVCSTSIMLLHDLLPRLRALDCVMIEKPFDLDNLLATLHALIAEPPRERARGA